MRYTTLLTILAAVLLYLVLGALVFGWLESSREEWAHRELLMSQMAFLQNHSCVTPYSLKEFTEKVVDAIEAGVDGRSTSNYTSRWDLSNAFFFCGTIITTIGFGNISPKTKGGQLFCIFYALVGIPMFGILLAGVGDHLGTLLRRAVAKTETLFLRKGVKPTSVRVISAVFSILIGCVVFLAVPTMVFQEVESWSLLEAVYFVVITLTTVGFGDYVAENRRDGTPLYKPLVWLWIVFGLAYFASILTMIGNWLRVLSKKTRAEMEELRAHATDWTQNIQNMSMDFRIPVPLDLNDPFQLQRRRRRKRHRHHRHPRLRAAGLSHGISLDADVVRENGHLILGWPACKYTPGSDIRSEALSRSRSWGRLDGAYEVRPGSRLMVGPASRSISRLELRSPSRPGSRAISRSPSESGTGSVSGSETPSESWSEYEYGSNSRNSEDLESGAEGTGSLGSQKDVPAVVVDSCSPPRPSLLDFFGENLAYIDESSDALSDRIKPAGQNRQRKAKRRSMTRQTPHSDPVGLQREISNELQPPSHPPTPPPPT
ncbi:potassium channel subfamily K member 4-like [Carassius gibelio]|uniref:potassium channel subfamily K member 4-like n=1 Tax=Carassius gibelio TaxID=101364 RepID=UPI0022780F5F|nr:potassium channel subfamily K member 4-like [Carassius gibelio]XP_052470253.1 potassium channel subfamily K member 4-like [Carassius gibelio]XP_052470254.1 potassium channel subfamily K member 4-like [Carassius gibelio]XP_052470255.1 potassium channel subfamily K member 4-like [Carassius gibelio]XP_052470257.1 potassium channel subfamily K member 4-like [Carassius gibelio]XP_052470258.1 potassium channel subfamily K member 4-like [Carassius gibelio]